MTSSWSVARKATAAIHISPRSPSFFLSFLLLAQDLATLRPCGFLAIGTIISLRIALNYRTTRSRQGCPTQEGGRLASNNYPHSSFSGVPGHSTALDRSMASALAVHTTTHESDHGWDGDKPIYTFHDSSRSLPPSEQPPASIFKELMDAPATFSDPHLKRLLTNNPQRLHTDVKGLWNSAPRSAHPVGTYERGVNYPRLFRLDSSFGLSVKELPGRQGLKAAPDLRVGTMPTNMVPAKVFSDHSSSSMSNPTRQVRSRAVSLLNQFLWRAHG